MTFASIGTRSESWRMAVWPLSQTNIAVLSRTLLKVGQVINYCSDKQAISLSSDRRWLFWGQITLSINLWGWIQWGGTPGQGASWWYMGTLRYSSAEWRSIAMTCIYNHFSFCAETWCAFAAWIIWLSQKLRQPQLWPWILKVYEPMRVSGIFEFYAYGVEIKLEVSLVAKSFIDS